MSKDQLHDWYINATNHTFDFGEYAAESWWEEALAVGSRELCERIADTTHRCADGEFLLRFAKERAAYREWLGIKAD